MLLYFSPLILGCFWPTSTLLHGHIVLAIPSLPETDPQILEHLGQADEDHLGKSFQAMDFFSNVSMTQHGFSELCTSDWFPYV